MPYTRNIALDEDRSPTGRQRSTRACDQCRRMKSKCQPSQDPTIDACQGCVSLGCACTFAGPSHKRGPPKGYILALERRLHQVEALLGSIIYSDDPRASTMVQDLSRDKMADYIIQRVKDGPFWPDGRLRQEFWSTKEDLMSCIMNGIEEDPSLTTENMALISPDRDWQFRLQNILSSSSPSLHLHNMNTSYPSPKSPQSASSSSQPSPLRDPPIRRDHQGLYPFSSQVKFESHPSGSRAYASANLNHMMGSPTPTSAPNTMLTTIHQPTPQPAQPYDQGSFSWIG